MAAVTSGRRSWEAFAVGIVLAVGLVGCTPSSDSGGDGPRVEASGSGSSVVPGVTSTMIAAMPATTYGGVPLGTQPCYVALPEKWRQRVEGGRLWSDVMSLSPGAPTPDGTGVFMSSAFGEAPSRFSIEGSGQQVVEELGSVDNPTGQGQYTYVSIDADHVVFAYEFTIGDQSTDQWAIYAGDRHTGVLTEIARNPVDADGVALPSAWVRPVLAHDYVYWVQATPDRVPRGSNELMQYAFATGQTRVIYRGLALGYVPFGSMILYGAATPNDPSAATPVGWSKVVEAADQATGLPVPAPAGLDFVQDHPDSVTTDGDMVVWSTPKLELRAWRAAWGRSITLVPRIWWSDQKLGVNAVDDPQLYGHFLIWRGGWVLDLTTNSFASLTKLNVSQGPTVAGDWLAWWDLGPGASNPPPPGGNPYTQYLINLKGLPDLPDCSQAVLPSP